MERDALDLLRYKRHKPHNHGKMTRLKRYETMRKMRTLCVDLDSDGLHVVADSLDSLMSRMSQEQQQGQQQGQAPQAAMLNASNMKQLDERLRNLAVQQSAIQNQLQGLGPEDLQQRQSLYDTLNRIQKEFAQIQAEMQNLQRSAG
jgi:hypothetical protein